jgi:hypothetical protein
VLAFRTAQLQAADLALSTHDSSLEVASTTGRPSTLRYKLAAARYACEPRPKWASVCGQISCSLVPMHVGAD